MKLITETSENIIVESQDKALYVSGIFSSANVKNKNGRIYEKKILDREINKILPKVNEKSLYGELNHPTSPDINLDRVAILVEDIHWHGDDIIGKAKVLEDTDKGRNLKGILSGGGKVGISSRGLGTVNESGFVNNDFDLICWDIVADASNPGSKYVNGIYEGKEFYTSAETSFQEANEIAFKHIWQVLETIEKNI